MVLKLSPSAVSGLELSGTANGARVIDYKKSWVRAFPRIIIGLVIAQVASLIVSIPLAPVVISGPVLLVLEVTILFLAASVFVRPTINPEARLKLRRVLRAEHVR